MPIGSCFVVSVCLKVEIVINAKICNNFQLQANFYPYSSDFYTALSSKNSSAYQKLHYFIARIRARFSLVLPILLVGFN